MQKLKDLLGILAIGLIAAVSLPAQSRVDLTYNTVPLKPGTFSGQGQAIQPDGKIVIWGGSLVIEGVPSGFVARLNSDGSRDSTFNFCGCGFLAVNSARILPDGKIAISGSKQTNDPNFNLAAVSRINADGSADNTFTTYGDFNSMFGFVTIIDVFPDGKIAAISSISLGFPFGTSTSVRVINANGVGSAFGIGIGQGQNFQDGLGGFSVLPDGRFYAGKYPATYSGTGELKRYTAAGAVDPTFTPPTFNTGVAVGSYSVDSQPDGNLLVGGGFTSINGAGLKNLARLTSTGAVDPTFTPPTNLSSIFRVKVLSSGKMLIVENGGGMRRLNANGSIDPTFVPAATVSSGFSLDATERIVFAGSSNYYRFNPNGDLDTSFNPTFATYGTISAMAKQADGKVVVAGDFTRINGTDRKGLARLNADGSVDPSLDPGTGFSYPPGKLFTQPDGKILALGGFDSYNGVSVPRLTRINANGSLDNTFTAVLNSTQIISSGLQSLAVQADGKILLFGDSFTINSVNRAGIARLNVDGSLDAGFNPVFTSKSAYVGGVVIEPDGKLTIGGFFTAINGVGRTNMARLNTDGTVASSFNPPIDPQDIFHMLVKGPDGKYYQYNSNAHLISRRNADGNADAAFQSPNFESDVAGYPAINNMFPQADGTVIVTGYFNRVQASQTSFTRHGIVHLKRNGNLDQFFIPSGVLNDSGNGVADSVQLPGNKILLGGDFTTVDNVVRARLARVIIQPYLPPNFDYDGDGRADISVFRPSNGNWYLSQTQGGLSVQNFGIKGDVLTPGDFDGDGKTDLAIWRPSTATWWYKSSANGGFYAVQWGQPGDIPLAEDFDGDGKSDFVLYRPSNFAWYRLGSSAGYVPIVFGTTGDIPLVGDFDGDGKADPTIYRPSTGTWWYASSVNGLFYALQWGTATDIIPTPGDYDGDGKTDPAYFRPSDGAWFVLYSGTAYTTYTAMLWGANGDRPVPADYDGDGKTDIAIFRPSNAMWFIIQSTGGPTGANFGLVGDKATPNAFVP